MVEKQVQDLQILVKDKKYFISEVTFYFPKQKEGGSQSTDRMIGLRYIDYNKVSGYTMSLENLKKDPNFAKKSEEEIRQELQGRYLKLQVSII